MKDNRVFYLTKSEDQVMNILWNAKEPMTQLQILQQAGSPDTRCFKDRSIFAILNGLLSKELVQEVGFVHSGKTFSRTFAPTKSRAEWYANELFHTLGKMRCASSAVLCETCLRIRKNNYPTLDL
ncbi:BlaI/MecI/CopY family transcriptional regulator [Gemmiger formicilis]|nr:BlaI/MecI/CopY family transcriptional regulator [Gemmiger formicilis]